MEILVFVKQVPDDFVEVRLDPAAGKPAVSGIEVVNNAFDTYALEMAARYREVCGGTVTAATVGPEGAQSGLKNLLAVGADRAYLFTCGSDLDETATAACLAKAAEKCAAENGRPFDLILCGRESTDEIGAQVGGMLSEELGLPFVPDVVEFTAQAASITARQETEDGSAFYAVNTPALFTVAKPNYDPRYPTIKNKMAARKAVIPTFPAEADTSARVQCLGYAEPPRRQAGVRLQEKEAADAAAKAVALMRTANVL